jgi:hypothetical protein
LNELSIRVIGISLRRARSLESLHLSENPGVTLGVKDALFSRVKCKNQRPNLVEKITDYNTDIQDRLLTDNLQALQNFNRAVSSIVDKNVSFMLSN